MIKDIFLPHINKLSSKFDEPNLLAEINQSIANGESFVQQADNSLAVIKFVFDEQNRIGIHVWVGINLKGKSLHYRFIEALQSAKATGVNFIRFETKRKGFDRIAPKLGFFKLGEREGFTVWQREVN